ncbi:MULTISPECIES: TetR/AcrR family transcriptional regulator [Microbacterium]|uniref:TetR/AcrR family transcriptional regulator n=1 Tax=Microbacterium TaxID=33882 RepID=UPI00217E8007|nr:MULTISPECIES: TetR/AcrR family transcriptional regulator [Microbacterium]UWF77043.1 TetR family transcriptional regulator [Microbacterium neungamense]WCM55203.1 TetR family transcriptional regulator [Microbacterium sp. EF45047]
MSTTRDRALDAAVDLVGTEGVRALTHARVDAAAGLPPGSTSNHFRTRAALLAGVIDWIAESERAEGGFPAPIETEQALVDMLVTAMEIESGPRAARTRARYALFLEAVDDEAVTPLRRQRRIFEEWTRSLLGAIGGPAAAERAPMLMAACDGLLLHRLTVDPDAPIAASVTLAVAAAVHGPAA